MCILHATDMKKFVQHHAYSVFVVTSAAVAIFVAILLRYFHNPARVKSESLVYGVQCGLMPLDIYVRVVILAILPCIAAVVIVGLGVSSCKAAWKLVFSSSGFFLITSLLALGQACLFGFVLRPGVYALMNSNASASILARPYRFYKQLNWLSTLDSELQTYALPEVETIGEITIKNSSIHVQDWIFMDAFAPKEIFGIFLASLVVGLGCSGSIFHCKITILNFASSLENALMVALRTLAWCSPVYGFVIIFLKILWVEDPCVVEDPLLSKLCLALGGALICHGVVCLPLLYLFFSFKNPIKYFGRCLPCLVTAFVTNSSVLAAPLLFSNISKNVENEHSSRYTGAMALTFQRNGRVIWSTISMIYLLDMNYGQITTTTVVSMCFFAIFLSFTCSSSVRIETFLRVWGTVASIPTNHIGALFIAEDFLGRLKTTTDVWSMCIAGAVVGHHNTLVHTDENLSKLETFEEDSVSGFSINDPRAAVVVEEPILTKYARITSKRGRDLTVKIFNEKGDKIVVSQV